MKDPKSFIHANFKQAKLLVIDDNDDQWQLMARNLRECIPEVTAVRVATSEEAMSLFTEWRHQEWELPKLILLDLYLPTRAAGWQLLQQLKAMDEPIRRIPLIVFTASSDPADVEAGYQLGISAYMIKPIEVAGWQSCFEQLRSYWWETVTLPPLRYGL